MLDQSALGVLAAVVLISSTSVSAGPIPAEADLGKAFYCDPIKGSLEGDGSASRPWRTIEDVLAARLIQLRNADGQPANPTAPVKPGDTVFLRSGWHGSLRIAKGYNDQFITFRPDPGHAPQVGVVEIGEGRRWRVKGLTISPSLAPMPPEGRGVRSLVMLGERGGTGTAELVVEDCFIFTTLDTKHWSAKDWIEKAVSGIWLGRHGRGHVARNNYILNTRFGINLCAPESVAEGNIIDGFSADGIRATRDGQIVQHNVIKNIYVGATDGDANHDDGIQVFLFNAGRGTVRDLVIRGNIILARERDGLPFPATLQGIGCFDGPLTRFAVEQNVIGVSHHHGVSLYDAQGCMIQDNVCYSSDARLRPWVMLGQKIKQARGNTVRNNFAHSFNFKADAGVKSEDNLIVTEALYHERQNELLAVINDKYGQLHPVAKLPRLVTSAAGTGPANGKATVKSLKGSLRAAVRNGGFSMEEHILWCPSVIQVAGVYHLFASRWPEEHGMAGWTRYSEVVRATATNLQGPYVFQEVVLQKRTNNWDNTRVHNPKVLKVGGKFVLFYIDTANETGIAVADEITGPWQRRDESLIRVSNPAALVRQDGSVYVFGRLGDERKVNRGIAFTARTIEGPYVPVAGGRNLLGNDAELEDPTIWWANGGINVLLNDWKGKATGVSKAGAHYFSQDGVNFALMSREPVFTKTVAFDDGSTETFSRRERPFVYVDEGDSLKALFTACLPAKGPARIVVQPLVESD